MTSSSEIEAYFAKNTAFMGCYSIDNLPLRVKQFPTSLIINTDPTTEPGDHWVAVYMTKTKCFYFDSFGLGIIDKSIIDFLKQFYKKVTINDECIQHYNSDKCGLYCIAFINKVKSKNTYNQFISNFNFVHLLDNDKIVLSLL